eukprot:02967.XXX_101935_103072_1 [CDS] Oithona nana genome sequencing.
MEEIKRRIGIVGYGHLGKFLTEAILNHPKLELAFVWNRTKAAFDNSKLQPYILEDLQEVAKTKPDLIVEVSHPIVVKQNGELFLKTCDFMLGSPTALADEDLEKTLYRAANQYKNGLYVPSGALWGGEDIRKMAERGSLKGVTVTMRKHPSSFKLNGDIAEKNAQVTDQELVLYEGPVRPLCSLAPNNVNTMAAAAIAANNLGLDKVIGRLVSDPNLPDWHIVEVEVFGPTNSLGNQFAVKSVRSNPADPGAVTGSATYNSFLSSIIRAQGKGSGVHLC